MTSKVVIAFTSLRLQGQCTLWAVLPGASRPRTLARGGIRPWGTVGAFWLMCHDFIFFLEKLQNCEKSTKRHQQYPHGR